MSDISTRLPLKVNIVPGTMNLTPAQIEVTREMGAVERLGRPALLTLRYDGDRWRLHEAGAPRMLTRNGRCAMDDEDENDG
jgi:hypothetical protein